jgi:WD40 repeat protein
VLFKDDRRRRKLPNTFRRSFTTQSCTIFADLVEGFGEHWAVQRVLAVQGYINTFAWSPGEQFMATADITGMVSITNIATEENVCHTFARCARFRWSPCGTKLLVIHPESYMLWDLKAGHRLFELNGFPAGFSFCSPDFSLFATVHGDKLELRRHLHEKLTLLTTIENAGADVSVSWSPCSQFLTTMIWNRSSAFPLSPRKWIGLFCVWDVSDGKLIRSFTIPSQSFPEVSFCQSGEFLMVKTTFQVDVRSSIDGSLVGKFQTHSNIYAAALSPDGRFLAVTTAHPWRSPREVKIIRVSDTKCVKTVKDEHVNQNSKLLWSPTGLSLAIKSSRYVTIIGHSELVA